MKTSLYVIVLLCVAVVVAAQPVGRQPHLPPIDGSADVDSLLLTVPAVEDLLEETVAWTPISTKATVFMTPVFPGWGQLYTRNSWRAAVTFGAITWYWSKMVTNDRQAERRQDFSRELEPGSNRDFWDAASVENRELMRDFGWWSGGGLLIACLDAYVGALLYRFDEDEVPVPNRWQILTPAPVPDAATGGVEAGVLLFEWRSAF